MKPVKVGLLGLGTVGQGTVNILIDNAAEITRRAGREIQVSHAVVRDLDKARQHGFSGVQLSTNASDVVENPEIDIVCELAGGIDLAREWVMTAIANGKHVVTANKALIAIHGNEIFSAALENGVTVTFESAVAGGIPIIKAVREGLAANRIEWLAGIINGTGNFILTEMRDKGRAFEDVLAEAQALGYAEADPTFDVEGIDAAHKLTILASLAFGVPLNFNGVYTEGISRITREDVAYAEELGYVIKHVGIARKNGEGIEVRVHPTLIPQDRLIANVNGVMNAVLVQGDAVGPTLYYGAGAGSKPTGSAVVADIIDVVRALTTAPNAKVPHLAFQPEHVAPMTFLASEQFECAYYLRLQAEDRPGVMAEVTSILGSQNISIEAIIQKEPVDGSTTVPVILLTRKVKESDLNSALNKINALPSITGDVARIRVEALG